MTDSVSVNGSKITIKISITAVFITHSRSTIKCLIADSYTSIYVIIINTTSSIINSNFTIIIISNQYNRYKNSYYHKYSFDK
jgi:hypothetical protein